MKALFLILSIVGLTLPVCGDHLLHPEKLRNEESKEQVIDVFSRITGLEIPADQVLFYSGGKDYSGDKNIYEIAYFTKGFTSDKGFETGLNLCQRLRFRLFAVMKNKEVLETESIVSNQYKVSSNCKADNQWVHFDNFVQNHSIIKTLLSELKKWTVSSERFDICNTKNTDEKIKCFEIVKSVQHLALSSIKFDPENSCKSDILLFEANFTNDGIKFSNVKFELDDKQIVIVDINAAQINY